MPRKKSKSATQCPPQLFGIYEDAANMGATGFCLENLPHAIMASFAVRDQATEIDFEFEAGQEMIDYFLSQPGVREDLRGRSLLQYRDVSMACQIEAEDVRRGQERIRVSWRTPTSPKRV